MVSEQANLNLLMSEVERLSDGLKVVISSGISDRGTILDPNTSVGAVQEALLRANVFLSGDINQEIMKAAQRRFVMETDGSMYRNWLVILTSMIGFAIAFRQSGSDFRARNQVERIVLLLLASAATIAIVASIGIVLSMVFEAVRFFDMHPWTDFFFGLVWRRRSDSKVNLPFCHCSGERFIFHSLRYLFQFQLAFLPRFIYLNMLANRSAPLPSHCWKFWQVFRRSFMVYLR